MNVSRSARTNALTAYASRLDYAIAMQDLFMMNRVKRASRTALHLVDPMGNARRPINALASKGTKRYIQI